MRRLLGTLLAAALVPVMVLSGTQVANAASNLNTWQTTNVEMHGVSSKLDPALGVECAVTARYTGVGESVQWANSECLGGLDMTPYSGQPGEAGTQVALEFRGTRVGEVAAPPPGPSVTKNNNPRWDFVPGSTTNFTAGTTDWVTVRLKNTFSTQLTPEATGLRCWNSTHTVINDGPSSGGGNYVQPLATYDTTNRCSSTNTSTSGGLAYVYSTWAGNGCTVPTGPDYCGSDYMYPAEIGPVGPVEGLGAGDTCTATSPVMTLLEYPGEDGWKGVASLIPDGAADVPEAPGGVCAFDQICVTATSGNGPLPDSEMHACADVDWPALAAPPPQGDTTTEPPPPAPVGHNNPDTPTTENGFWEEILGLLSSGFVAVVAAVSDIASGILGGLGALFIPSFGSWGLDQLIEQARARAPFSVVAGAGAGVQSISDAYQSGGGCGSLANFTSDDIAANLTCSKVKDSPGMGTLYGIVQLAFWSLTGLGIFKMIAGAVA